MKMHLLIVSMSLGLCLPQLSRALPPENCDDPGGPYSPLIVDTLGNGIRLGPAGVGVYFDMYANGMPVHMQWVRRGGDEAFLVADLNGNGRIDNGSELFGEGTALIFEGGLAENGYIALGQYDDPALGGNDDGLISRADTIWPTLRLWIDSNADGRSTRAELKTPEALRMISFETIPKDSPHVDAAGNSMPLYSWVTRLLGLKTLMVDG